MPQDITDAPESIPIDPELLALEQTHIADHNRPQYNCEKLSFGGVPVGLKGNENEDICITSIAYLGGNVGDALYDRYGKLRDPNDNSEQSVKQEDSSRSNSKDLEETGSGNETGDHYGETGPEDEADDCHSDGWIQGIDFMDIRRLDPSHGSTRGQPTGGDLSSRLDEGDNLDTEGDAMGRSGENGDEHDDVSTGHAESDENQDGTGDDVHTSPDSDRVLPVMLPPPVPSELFPTGEIAVNFCQQWARQHGYALSRVQGSEKGRRIVLACDRGGDSERRKERREQAKDKRREEGRKERKKGQGTSKVGCPFKLSLWRQRYGGWKLVLTNPNHEFHEASSEPIGHSHLRRLTLEQYDFVEKQTNVGVMSSNILKGLREK
ncbi:hypothetical protein BJ508DRAFT_327810 [Ascobolus immersus RN42]|uniref:FAR1 domain-containing protein n=1 Tax=Ascobolus immersus RN42 TaxID=1160509 RepID=A0A3N4IE14_ASCIM|nr:hypothetical protein BJ508DRAFT_327810 [Ascobolus immersus RN42]